LDQQKSINKDKAKINNPTALPTNSAGDLATNIQLDDYASWLSLPEGVCVFNF